jgi:hypothetical protein
MLRAWLAGLVVAGVVGIAGAAPAPPAPPGGNAKDPNSAVLVLKGKDFFIHALPAALEERLRMMWGRRLDEARITTLVLLHTSTSSGEMKRLMSSGSSSHPGPPRGMSWTHHQQVRIAGIAADSQRLYVLRWLAFGSTLEGDGFNPTLENGRYRLAVFRPGDGKQLHDIEVKGAEVAKPKKGDRRPPPEETVGKGPLRLVEGGVSCLGVRLLFAGEKFLLREADR